MTTITWSDLEGASSMKNTGEQYTIVQETASTLITLSDDGQWLPQSPTHIISLRRRKRLLLQGPRGMHQPRLALRERRSLSFSIRDCVCTRESLYPSREHTIRNKMREGRGVVRVHFFFPLSLAQCDAGRNCRPSSSLQQKLFCVAGIERSWV